MNGTLISNFPQCVKTLLLASALVASPIALAQTAEDLEVNIRAKALDQALVDIGRAFDVVVVAPADLTEGLQAQTIRGRLTALEAIRQALGGTGLTVEETDSGALLVKRAPETDASATGQTSAVDSVEEPVTDRITVYALESEWNQTINNKRNARTISDFASADTLGQFIDDDIGDIVERMPGIYTSGAGQSGGAGVSVRGLRGDFNSLQVNGNRLPSNQGQTRGVTIDTVPAELIGGIEVLKAVTPDREADSIGGLVNIETKSGLDFDERFFGGQAGYGMFEVGDSDQWLASLNYGERIGDFGVFAAISYRQEERQRDEYELDPGDYVFEQLVSRDLNVEEITEDNAESIFSYGRSTISRVNQSQENLGLTLNLDWQASDLTVISFRSFFSEFEEERPEWRARYRFDRSDDDDPIGEAFGDSDFVFLEENGLLYFGDDQRIRKRVAEQWETETIQNYDLSFEHELAKGELWGGYSWSRAQRDLSSDDYLWEADDIPMLVDVRDIQNARFALLQPGDPNFADDFNQSDLFDPFYWTDEGDGFFEISERRNEVVDAKDTINAFNLDYRHFLEESARTSFIQVGTKFRSQEKINQRDFVIVEDFTFDGAAADFLTINNWFEDDRIDLGIFPTYDFMRLQNPTTPAQAILDSLTTAPRDDDLASSIGQDFEISEDVFSIYAMGSVESDNWSLLGGIRYERTTLDYRGYNVDGALGILPDFANPVFDIDGDRSYDGIYPSIHFTGILRDDLLLRAHIGRTLARPSFQELFPSTFAMGSDDDGNDINDLVEIERGNVDLEPTESTNFDLSLEYYSGTGGLVSLALFYKDIENWIFEDTRRTDIANFPQYQGIDEIDTVIVQSFFNGDSAEVTGLEFNARHPIGAGFSGEFNYTWLDVSLNEEETGLDRIPGQADQILNLALAYENRWVTARIVYRYISEILDERLTDSGFVDLFGQRSVGLFAGEERRLDFIADAHINENFSIFLRWRNITGEKRKDFLNNDKSFPVEIENEGYEFLTGLKWNF